MSDTDHIRFLGHFLETSSGKVRLSTVRELMGFTEKAEALIERIKLMHPSANIISFSGIQYLKGFSLRDDLAVRHREAERSPSRTDSASGGPTGNRLSAGCWDATGSPGQSNMTLRSDRIGEEQATALEAGSVCYDDHIFTARRDMQEHIDEISSQASPSRAGRGGLRGDRSDRDDVIVRRSGQMATGSVKEGSVRCPSRTPGRPVRSIASDGDGDIHEQDLELRISAAVNAAKIEWLLEKQDLKTEADVLGERVRNWEKRFSEQKELITQLREANHASQRTGLFHDEHESRRRTAWKEEVERLRLATEWECWICERNWSNRYTQLVSASRHVYEAAFVLRQERCLSCAPVIVPGGTHSGQLGGAGANGAAGRGRSHLVRRAESYGSLRLLEARLEELRITATRGL
jgi:hypothetical protein